MNALILRSSKIRLNSKVGFIFITVVVLFLYSVRAFAISIDTYEYEYERTDIPTSAIKRGQKLGTLYLKQQTITVWRNVDVNNTVKSLTASISPIFSLRSTGTGPGCTGPNDDGSFGVLRFTGSTTETTCDYYRPSYIIVDGLTAYPTHNSIYTQGQYFYSFKLLIPRTKIADVVVNDPAKALTHAGQTVQLGTTPLLMPSLQQYTTLRVAARTPMTVLIGETPPAVFFPQQNTYHAVLPVKIMPSGDVATGSASLDMCLYDGAGLYNSHYMLTFTDENSASLSRDFTMHREGGAGDISYSVSVTDPSGKPQSVANREPFYWNNMQNGGAAQGRLRYVQLPNGIQGTVPCVPSVVTVKVRPVRYASLMAGSYRGKINILFTPST